MLRAYVFGWAIHLTRYVAEQSYFEYALKQTYLALACFGAAKAFGLFTKSYRVF